MRWSTKQYAGALAELLEKVSEGEREKIIRDFASLIRKHRAERLVPQIANLAERISETQAGRLNLSVEAATRDTAESAIKKISASGAKKITVNPSLIGGIRTTLGEWRADTTMKHRLQVLKQSIGI